MKQLLNEYIRMNIKEHSVNKQMLMNEALITLDNQRPNYNQVIIMAGGSGSGKGYVLKNLVGVQGKVYDVDKLKEFAFQSDTIQRNIQKTQNINIFDLDLNKAEDNTKLHEIIKNLNIDEKAFKLMFNDFINHSNNKPNLIFDVTLADLTKLSKISTMAQKFGYLKENIHIVWVVNDINIAIQQNLSRGRTVPADIFQIIHNAVKSSLLSILNKEIQINQYMDGDFWIVFNKKAFDTQTTKSNNGGSFINKASTIKIKSKNQDFDNNNNIIANITNKIIQYSKIK